MKDPKYWTIKTCKQCGKKFEVYRNYVRRGGGKFCSRSCSATYRNIHNNPTKDPKVREKISRNHADVSGKNNPMYGVRGKDAPGYIDGRNKYVGESYRKKALANLEHICEECGETDLSKLEVHHKDFNRKNNKLENLMFVCTWCHNNIYHPRERDELGRFV